MFGSDQDLRELLGLEKGHDWEGVYPGCMMRTKLACDPEDCGGLIGACFDKGQSFLLFLSGELVGGCALEK